MIYGRNKHTHLKEPTGVVLFEDLQTELHHPCGLTELHGAVGDLVSHHLRIRFKKKLLGQRAKEDRGFGGGWSEGGGCTSYFYLFMEMEGSLPDRVLLCSAFVQTKARQQSKPQLYFNFLPVPPSSPPAPPRGLAVTPVSHEDEEIFHYVPDVSENEICSCKDWNMSRQTARFKTGRVQRPAEGRGV